MTSDSLSPVVSETSVLLGLSHSLAILSESGIEVVRDELEVVSISGVSLSVEEPGGNVVVLGSGEDVINKGDLLLGELSSSLGGINLSDLKNKSGHSSSDSSNLSNSEGSLLFTVDVSVLDSEKSDEIVGILENK